MIYTVTLNPAIDYAMHVDNLTAGQVNRSHGEYVLYGGKGINVSTVLHNLGVESIALGFVALKLRAQRKRILMRQVPKFQKMSLKSFLRNWRK